MPSTYSTNLGIELPQDGELDGVWGEVVNDNMNILDRAANGSISLTLVGTSSTLTTSNGTLSDGQYRLLVLAGTPSGTHTITIAPNTAQKIYYVRNTTAQSVVFTQGSGGNITVATGDSAIIYTNGAGSTAAVNSISDHFALSSVRITGGSIDGVIIGGTTAAAGTFTSGTFTSVTSPSFTNAGTLALSATGANAITMSTNGAERLRITGAGNVGIGTVTPVLPLEVRGPSGNGILFLETTTGNSNRVQLGAGNGFGYIDATTATGDTALVFQVASTERMRIDSAGDVGIGTTTPVNKFHISMTPPVAVPSAGANGHALGVGTLPYGLAAGVLDSGTAYLQATRWDGTATNYDMIVQPNGGNVGIGTTLPTSFGANYTTVQANGRATTAGGVFRTSNSDASAVGDFLVDASIVTLRSATNVPLTFHTNSIERMRLDTAGNLGLDATPSPWVAGSKALQLGSSGYTALSQATGGDSNLTSNAYLSAAGVWRSIATVGAGRYQLDFGVHRWFTAPSVTAGSVLTFTQAMTLDASGHLGVGASTITPIFGRTLQVGDGTTLASISLLGTGAGTTGDIFLTSGASTAGLYSRAATDLIFGTVDVERMRIDSVGNLGLGVTPSAWGSNFRAFDLAGNVGIAGFSNSLYQITNAYAENAAYRYKASTFASMYLQTAGQHQWYNAPSGTAGNLVTFTQAMTLHASGGLSIGNTTDPGATNLSVTGSVDMTTLSIGGTAVTSTAAELNFVDGVTSAIQTQLDNRVTSNADDALTGGYTTTAVDDGTRPTAGNPYTPAPSGGNMKRIINGGAFTLSAPSASGDYTLVIQITNNASAGAITLSGFSRSTGDAFTTTNGHDFFVFITKCNGFTSANVQALQ